MANEIPIDLVMRVNDQMSTVLDSVAAAADGTSRSFDKMTDEGTQISNNLTRQIPLLERISTRFLGVSDSAKKATGIKWDESTNRWRDASNKFISSQEAMQKGFTAADKALYQYKKEAGSAEDATSKLAKSMQSGTQQTGGFSVKLAALGNIAGDLAMKALSAVGAAVGDVVGEMINGNAEMQRYETQFGVLLGSTDKAKERLKELAEFGASTPFELPEVVRADKILQGFGLHSEESAKKFGLSGTQIRTLAGDMAAGTGQSFEDMAGYLGKFASGSTGEAISRFQELGITTREELAKMGLEFSKSGELTTPTAEAFAVLAKVAQEKFGGMMNAQSATFEGMVSNLEDWKSQTIRTIGEPIFEILGDKLGGLLGLLSSPMMTEWITNFANSIASSLGSIIDWFDKTFGKAFDLFVSMDEWSSGTAEGIGGVIDEMLGLNSVFQKAGELLDLSDEWSSGFLETVGGVIDSLLGLENVFQLVGSTIDKTVKDIFTNTQEDFGAMSDTITNVMDGIAKIVDEVLYHVMEFWQDNGAEITAYIKETWTTLSDIINGVMEVIFKVIELILPKIQKDVEYYMYGIRAVFEIVWAAIKIVVGTSLDMLKGLVNTVLAVLNGDTDKALKIIQETFNSIWTRIVDVVTEMIEDIKKIIDDQLALSGSSIDKQLAAIEKFFTDAWTNIYTAVETAINNVRSWVSGVLTKINDDADWWLNTIKNRWNTFTKNVYDDVVKKFDDIESYVVGILKAIIDVFTTKIPDAVTAAGEFIGGIAAAISDKVTVIVAYGTAIISGFIEKITNGVETARSAMAGVMSAIGGAIDEKLSAIYDFGANIVTNIANGIKSAPGVIMQALNDIVIGAVNSLLAKFGIAPISTITGVTGGRAGISSTTGAPASRATTFNLTANYGNQDERSLRDDVQMLQMLYGGV